MTRVRMLLVTGAVVLLALSGCAQGPGSTRATWNVLGAVTMTSTSLEIGVQRADCANGVTGDLWDPVVAYEADRIVITAQAAPNGLTAADCPSNDIVRQTVELSEPVGERSLVDGLCLAEDQIPGFCANGGVRWIPASDDTALTVTIDIAQDAWQIIDGALDNAVSNAIDSYDPELAANASRIRESGADATSEVDDGTLSIELREGDRPLIETALAGDADAVDALAAFEAAWTAAVSNG